MREWGPGIHISTFMFWLTGCCHKRCLPRQSGAGCEAGAAAGTALGWGCACLPLNMMIRMIYLSWFSVCLVVMKNDHSLKRSVRLFHPNFLKGLSVSFFVLVAGPSVYLFCVYLCLWNAIQKILRVEHVKAFKKANDVLAIIQCLGCWNNFCFLTSPSSPQLFISI